MAASLGRVLAFVIVLQCCYYIYALREQGYIEFQLTQHDRAAVVERTVFANTKLFGLFGCSHYECELYNSDTDPSVYGKVVLYVLWFPCAKDFHKLLGKGDYQLSVKDFIQQIKYGSSEYQQEMYIQMNFTRNDDYLIHFPNNLVLATERTGGTHILILYYSSNPELMSEHPHLSGYIKLKGPEGYLSKSDWPLLPFYGTMVAVYAVCGLVWCAVIISWCDKKTGVWIQGCIALIILVGIVEYALFFTDVMHLIDHAHSLPGAQVSAEVLSSIKRTIAAVVGILISLGFGVVRPPCGATLAKVLKIGVLYICLALAECCVRVLIDNDVAVLSTNIPLAVLDVAICCFILIYLWKNIAELRLRKNELELSLYKYFRYMLILAITASVVYYIWILVEKLFGFCIDSSVVWLEEAYCHILFFIVLLIVMALWRPTVKYHTSVYSPLPNDDPTQSHDGDDDDTLLDITTDDSATGTDNHETTDDKHLNTTGAIESGVENKTKVQSGGIKATITAIMEGITDRFKYFQNDNEVRTMKKEKMKKELEKSEIELENVKLENKFLHLKIEKLQKQPQEPDQLVQPHESRHLVQPQQLVQPEQSQQLVQPEATVSENIDEAEQTGGLDVEDVLVHQYNTQ